MEITFVSLNLFIKPINVGGYPCAFRNVGGYPCAFRNVDTFCNVNTLTNTWYDMQHCTALWAMQYTVNDVICRNVRFNTINSIG